MLNKTATIMKLFILDQRLGNWVRLNYVPLHPFYIGVKFGSDALGYLDCNLHGIRRVS